MSVKEKLVFLIIILCIALGGCQDNKGRAALDINALKYVDLADYKNLYISSDYTYISSEDVENIINWDMTSSDSFIEVTTRDTVKDDDIVLLTLMNADETTSMFYELDDEETFKDNDVFRGRKIGDIITVEYMGFGNNYTPILVRVDAIYRWPEISDEEFLLEYYGLDTMQDLYDFIKKRASNEIVYNYMWEMILEESTVTHWPSTITKLIKESTSDLRKEAAALNKSVDEYLQSVGFASYSDYIELKYSYYTEYIIAKAILDSEGVVITDSNIENTKREIARRLDITEDDVAMYYSSDDIFCRTIMTLLKDTLVELAIIQ